MEFDNYKHSDITEKILKAYFIVYNKLGFGFLERVYEKAMIIELRKQGLSAETQSPVKVFYDEEVIGDYYADIIVNGVVIIELKAVECIIPVHEVQLVNYLKATDIEVGILLNFGKEPEFKRKVFTKYQRKRQK
jgi:GxxExxY protein